MSGGPRRRGAILVVCGLLDVVRCESKMLDCGDGLPSQVRRIPHGMQLGRRGAVEHDIEPVIVLESLRRAVFVGRHRDLANTGAAFDLDKPHFDGGVRVLRVRPARNQVESAVLRFDALDLEAVGFLMLDGDADRDLLNLRVADHAGDLGLVTVWMGQHPGPAEQGHVGDRAVAFEFNLAPTRIEAVVQVVEVLLGLGDQAIETL